LVAVVTGGPPCEEDQLARRPEPGL
jgi:hypothetical protein